MKRACLLLAVLTVAGCHRELVPYLGKWNGGFVTEKDPKQNNLNGYLQLYATNQGFALHLDGAQEGIDLTGSWSHEGKLVTLKVVGVKVDDQSGAANRDPSKPFIAPEAIQLAYGKEIRLTLSADGQKLEGQRMSIGPILGTHRFEKVGPGR